MISPEVLRSFSDEVTKVAMDPKTKALVAATGLTAAAGGIAAGVKGEQVKDDYVAGREMRRQQEAMRKQQRDAMRGM